MTEVRESIEFDHFLLNDHRVYGMDGVGETMQFEAEQ